ncbi:hypothetical protein KRM28CT15_15290 [Krasilnikovia sp. M28-CT-15]
MDALRLRTGDVMISLGIPSAERVEPIDQVPARCTVQEHGIHPDILPTGGKLRSNARICRLQDDDGVALPGCSVDEMAAYCVGAGGRAGLLQR